MSSNDGHREALSDDIRTDSDNQVNNLNDSVSITTDIDEEIQMLSDFKGLKFIHLNCTLLLKNIDELRHLNARICPDFCASSEKHIMIHDSEVKIDGYNIVRKDRDRHGGGVAAYIKTNLNFIVHHDLMSDELELLSIELQFTHI